MDRDPDQDASVKSCGPQMKFKRTAFMYLPQVLLKELIVIVQKAEMCEKILTYFNIFVL